MGLLFGVGGGTAFERFEGIPKKTQTACRGFEGNALSFFKAIVPQ